MKSIFLLLLFAFNVFGTSIPVLCYHRLSNTQQDSMTIKTDAFNQQMEWLKIHGYKPVSLATALGILRNKTIVNYRPVVITVDDGHQSVYTDMAPIIKKYHYPVTLFIYPSAISNAKYAMTWEELKALEKTGLFEVQSHTYWHPNFKKEKKHLSQFEYQQFVKKQLLGSKQKLEEKMGHKIDYLAWVFGIYDTELEKEAKLYGYKAAFTIERRHAVATDKETSLPRYMIVKVHSLKDFEKIILGKESKSSMKSIGY